MFLKGVSATDFPELKDYLYRRFMKVMDSKKIVEAMGTHGSLEEHSFRAALMVGTPPFVEVRTILPGNYGKLDVTFPGILVLDWETVNNYEENR